MYDELVKRLREACELSACGECGYKGDKKGPLFKEAADAIEELRAKVSSLQFFADSISKLPDCNTCIKKNLCKFKPNYGEYCRINCPAWTGEPPKEEA